MRLFNVGREKLLKAGLAQQLLHGGDTKNFSLIGVKSYAFNSSGNIGLTGVLAVGTTFDQFPAGPFLTADGLLKGIRVTFGVGEKTFIFPDAFKQGFLKMKE